MGIACFVFLVENLRAQTGVLCSNPDGDRVEVGGRKTPGRHLLSGVRASSNAALFRFEHVARPPDRTHWWSGVRK